MRALRADRIPPRFLWLLCGMLLPSVALVAFGVVAVANERAAVERRLTEDYDARGPAARSRSNRSLAWTGGGRGRGRGTDPPDRVGAVLDFRLRS